MKVLNFTLVYFRVLEQEKQELLKENLKLKSNVEAFNQLQKLLDETKREKEVLQSRIEKYKTEVDTLRNDYESEHQKYQALLANVNESNKGWEELKKELEVRHAKEMDKMRTYFEQKCLEIKEQYSEEIFSQQSKKMSDDSEIEELTDDLYFGGSGDCVNGQQSVNQSMIKLKDFEIMKANYEQRLKELQDQIDEKTGTNAGRVNLLASINQVIFIINYCLSSQLK